MTQANEDRMQRSENTALLQSIKESVQEISGEVKDIQRRVTIIETRDNPAVLAALALRVTALEVDAHKRAGATGLMEMLMKSPALGWLVGQQSRLGQFLQVVSPYNASCAGLHGIAAVVHRMGNIHRNNIHRKHGASAVYLGRVSVRSALSNIINQRILT